VARGSTFTLLRSEKSNGSGRPGTFVCNGELADNPYDPFDASMPSGMYLEGLQMQQLLQAQVLWEGAMSEEEKDPGAQPCNQPGQLPAAMPRCCTEPANSGRRPRRSHPGEHYFSGSSSTPPFSVAAVPQPKMMPYNGVVPQQAHWLNSPRNQPGGQPKQAGTTRRACMIGAEPDASTSATPSAGQAWGRRGKSFRKEEVRDLGHIERHLAGELFRAQQLVDAEMEAVRGGGNRKKSESDRRTFSFLPRSKSTSQSTSQTESRSFAFMPRCVSNSSQASGVKAKYQQDNATDQAHNPATTIGAPEGKPLGDSEGSLFGQTDVLQQAMVLPDTTAEKDPSSSVTKLSGDLMESEASGQDPEDPLHPFWPRTQHRRLPTCNALSMQNAVEIAKAAEFEMGMGTHELDEGAYSFKSSEIRYADIEKSWRMRVYLAFGDCGRFILFIVPRISGVIPWSCKLPRHWQWWPATFYHWVVFGSILHLTVQGCTLTYKEFDIPSEEGSAKIVNCMDSILASGALLALLFAGTPWRSRTLVDCWKVMRCYACKAGFLLQWEDLSCMDIWITVSLWFFAVLARAMSTLVANEMQSIDWLAVAKFAFISSVHMGVSTFILCICRCLTKMIDCFCFHIIEEADFGEALREWSLQQALCRMSCMSMQHVFMVSQATATGAVLLSITQVNQENPCRCIALLPGLLIALVVLRTMMVAASVTDKCARVPMLVNSISVGTDLDQERMYTVEYIVHSQAGFYFLEVRLTTSTVLKTVYIACAVTFALASQIL